MAMKTSKKMMGGNQMGGMGKMGKAGKKGKMGGKGKMSKKGDPKKGSSVFGRDAQKTRGQQGGCQSCKKGASGGSTQPPQGSSTKEAQSQGGGDKLQQIADLLVEMGVPQNLADKLTEKLASKAQDK